MSWEDIEKLETRLIYKDEQISDLTKENEAIRESLEIERAENAELQTKALGLEGERDGWQRSYELVAARLPLGMKDCTIVFKQCEKGHGWLSATNWAPCRVPCPWCALAEAEARAERYREALATINLMCASGYYGPLSLTYAMEAKRLASAALLPPPEPAGGSNG